MGEACEIEEDALSEASSFYDDGIPESEEEFFTSDFEEGAQAQAYVPPWGRNKSHFSYLLDRVGNIPDDDEEAIAEYKTRKTKEVMGKWDEFINGRRAWRAHERLKKVMASSYDDHNIDAFALEKLELVDKNLQKPYYYEKVEPFVYKKLLLKRRRAIKRKYEMYALDEGFRDQYQKRIIDDAMKYKLRKGPRFYKAMSQFDHDMSNYSRMESFLNKDDDIKPPDKIRDDSDASSMYDDELPYSEMEFFQSDLEYDLPCPHPGPLSRNFGRYKRFLGKAREDSEDDEETIEAKKLLKAEVTANWSNFIEKKRAIKALTRIKALDSLNYQSPHLQAALLSEWEIKDKKLNKNYYYCKHDLSLYRKLHEKRKQAIAAKFMKFAEDPHFRNEYRHRIYVQFLRIRDAPMFERPLDEVDSVSSFNDSEVPSSEEEFMSRTELCIPERKERDQTRMRSYLFEELDLYEPDPDNDNNYCKECKRLMRYALLNQFRGYLKYRRRQRALKRVDQIEQIGTNDPGIIAQKLFELELKDKHLNKSYYYTPDEDCIWNELVDKRLRAIERKYDRFIEDKSYREEYLERVKNEAALHIQNDE